MCGVDDLAHWLRQVEFYGGFEFAPLATRSSICAARKMIATIEARLSEMGS